MSPDKIRHELASSFTIVEERSSTDEICIMCPVPGCPDKTGNRFVNTKTLRTHCWRCGSNQPKHVKSLFRLLGLDFDDTHILEPEELREMLSGEVREALTPIQEVELPKGFELLTENRDSCYWDLCRRMAERKNLSIEDFEAAQAGFTREGRWEPFCIFPVIEGPRIVYYQGRTYTDEGFENTKKFPSRKVVPYGMRYWVYGLDQLQDKSIRTVIVVESILNQLSLKRRLRELEMPHIAAICTFTHYITRAQVAKMRQYGYIEEWCLLFDSDSTDLAEQTALNMSAVLPMSYARMPVGKNLDGTERTTNDANDDVDAALLAVNERGTPNINKVSIKKCTPFDRPYRVASDFEL